MANDDQAPSLPSRAEAVALLKGGLGLAMQNVAASYVMPLCWVYADEGRPVLPNNGSAFLLDAGEGPFLVTAAHVYRGFLAAKKEHADAVCLISEVRFPLEERLIAENELYDVATFRVDASELALLGQSGKIPLTGSNASWPPGPPEVDHGVFFVGFPGDGRSVRPYRGNSFIEIDWLGYTALAIATSVSAAGITLVFDHDNQVDIGLRPRAPSDTDLGGCSGAPLLTFIERRGVFSWQLGGIIYECSSSSMFLKAARADCLRRDGTINVYPDPMASRKPGA